MAEGRIVAAGALADQGDLKGALKLMERGAEVPKKVRDHHLRQWYVLADLYEEHAASIEQLRAECAPFHTPEDINERKETSPSHRIKTRVPNYVKEDGFRFLQSIGVPELKAHCPRFKAWLERCEVFFR